MGKSATEFVLLMLYIFKTCYFVCVYGAQCAFQLCLNIHWKIGRGARWPGGQQRFRCSKNHDWIKFRWKVRRRKNAGKRKSKNFKVLASKNGARNARLLWQEKLDFHPRMYKFKIYAWLYGKRNRWPRNGSFFANQVLFVRLFVCWRIAFRAAQERKQQQHCDLINFKWSKPIAKSNFKKTHPYTLFIFVWN